MIMNWKNDVEFEAKAKKWCNEYAEGLSVVGEGDVVDHGDTFIVYFETMDSRSETLALIEMKIVATMDEETWNISAEGRFQNQEDFRFLDYV